MIYILRGLPGIGKSSWINGHWPQQPQRWLVEVFSADNCNGDPIPAVAARQARCEEHGWTKIVLPMTA